MSSAPAIPAVELTYFPDRRAWNPYQSVLYGALAPSVCARPGRIEEAGSGTPGSLAVFHLHWEEAVWTDTRQSPEAFLERLGQFCGEGGRLIWTVHNIEPHDPSLRPISRDLRAGLLRLADVVHVHSTHALAALAVGWGALPRRARVIPHPGYDRCYPIMDRGAARAETGLAGTRMVLLAPGRIAAYKQTDDLVRAFLRVARPDDVLLVAGALAAGHCIGTVADARVRLLANFASPEDFARFHAACDLVVLPYAASLTSGSAILAATLGRGVLGADTPGLRDAVLPNITGTLYDPIGGSALPEAMRASLDEGPEVWAWRGRQAALAAQGRDPVMIGRMWMDVLTMLGATSATARREGTPQ